MLGCGHSYILAPGISPERRGTMPGFDGTGPYGRGPMTGGGRGFCAVPLNIPGVELDRFEPGNYYSDEQIEQLSHNLKNERVKWLSRFPSLDADILNAIKW